MVQRFGLILCPSPKRLRNAVEEENLSHLNEDLVLITATRPLSFIKTLYAGDSGFSSIACVFDSLMKCFIFNNASEYIVFCDICRDVDAGENLE